MKKTIILIFTMLALIIVSGSINKSYAFDFTSITPNVGSVDGGDSVTINGRNFVSGMTVKIGSNNCTSVNVLSSTSLTATTPQSSVSGPVSIVLSYNSSAYTFTNSFTYEKYLDTFAIIADSAQAGTFNILIIGKNGYTYIAKDPDINLTIGITQIVSGNYAVMPLITPLVKGQRIYISDFTTPGGGDSSMVTVGTTLSPFLAGGLYGGDSYVEGIAGSAVNGTSFNVLKLGSGANDDKIEVVGVGNVGDSMFTSATSVDLEDGDILVPYINGLAGGIVIVGSSKGPTIKWPQSTNSVTVEGIGTPGEEVRLYDISSQGSVVASTNVGTDGSYAMTIDKSYTTQGNILSVIGYSVSNSTRILGGIITVGSTTSGPKINNTSARQVKDGDSQITGTGSSGQRVVIERMALRTVLGNGVVGTDSNFTAALTNALQGQQKIVSIENNISGEIITVAGTGNISLIGNYGNYPNPFDPNKESTTIEYTLNQNVNIVIHIYNISAVEIQTIECPATTNGGKSGLNQVIWDGKDGYGQGCSTGVYLYRIFDTDNKTVLGKGKIAVIRK